MEVTPEIKTRTEVIQNECHHTVEQMADAIKLEGKELKEGFYQDFTNVFLFEKIAELQLKIESINKYQI